MSTESNVYSQGGGGTTYEFEVNTAFMIQFLIGGVMPGLQDSQIESIRFQSGSLGYKTDDLLIQCVSNTGETQRILLQVKHVLTISEKNTLFQDVLQRAWRDFTNEDLFNQTSDKIYLVKSYLTTDEKKHLKTLCNWAKVKKSSSDFINETNRISAKKFYLDLFRKLISNEKGNSLTDEEMFSFFRCFDILELDFGENNSTSKSSFLAIIEHAKDHSCSLLPFQVWSEVFSFVSHADNKGGSFDRANLPSHIRAYFKSSYYVSLQRRLKQLSIQSIEILDLIEESIGTFSISRGNYQEKIYAEFTRNNQVLITGEPGSGKSAIAKQFLKTIIESNNSFLLVFRADEFGRGNLRDYFSGLDIQLSITEIFRFFPLHTLHFIYVDALEKLSESEGIAFKQLLSVIIHYPHIKLLATCREAEFPLLRLKYFSAYEITPIRVDVLSEVELKDTANALPILSPVLQNRRLLPLLQFPKYLDLTYRAAQQSAINFSEIDEQQFVNQLWEVIVENKLNANVQGLPAKRSELFTELAVNRAKSMSPYVVLNSVDLHALSELEKDGVVVKSKRQEAYAPAHDILEDWALERHAERVFHTSPTPSAFFAALGVEPAMRRAYRLWALQIFKYGSSQQKTFFATVLSDNSLPSFWGDESIIALLYSPYLKEFLQTYRDLLHKDEWVLLAKLIHVMRTACRELGELTDTKEKKFLPIGDCWQHIFQSILDSIIALPEKHYDLVLQTVNDWHLVLHSHNATGVITLAPGRVVKWLLENHYINTDSYYNNENIKQCLNLVFDCSGSILEETKQLFIVALNKKNRDRNNIERKIVKFNDEIVELSLTGLASKQLAKHMPEMLLQMMKQEWIYKPPVRKKGESETDWYFRNMGSRTDGNIPFGIVSEFKRRNYFPASAFQTPIYWLLKHHTKATLAFVIDLLNHATESFSKSDYASSDERETVTLYLPGNSSIDQLGSMGLWCMFRGTGISTPYLLQSVLMALEKFLLETASEGLEKKEIFQDYIEQILTKSKGVSLTAVVASVAQAYPMMVGKWVVPLFSHRKLLYWDITRYQRDFNPLNLRPLPSDHIFWLERNESNKLPHRLKHNPGLKGFIVDYCFNIREHNAEFFALLNKLKKKSKRNDWQWKKILAEIDIRNWQVTKTERVEDGVRYQIEPVHKGRLKEEVQKMQEDAAFFLDSGEKSSWLLRVNDGKQEADLSKWRSIINEYRELEVTNPMHHHPGIAAAIGIRYFWSELNQDERQCCYDMVTSIASHLLQKEITYDYLSLDISPFDDDAVMIALTLLFNKEEIDADEFMVELAQVLFANVSYNTLWYNRFLEAFSNNVWKSRPAHAFRLWKALVLFAKLEKANPAYRHRPHNEEEMKTYLAKEEELFSRLAEDKLHIEIDELNLSDYSQWAWRKVVKMLPSTNCPLESVHFLMRLVDLFIAEQFATKKRGDIYNDDNDKFNIELKFELQDKIAQIILWNAPTTGKDLFRELLNRYYDPKVMEAENRKAKGEIGGLIRAVLEHIIYITDQNLPDDQPEKQAHTVSCFKTVWEEYFRLSLEKGYILFGDLLFLGTNWGEDARHWKPLESMESFFKGIIALLGSDFVPAVVNLLSHVGDKTLLPTGLSLLWQSIQQNKVPQPVLSIPKITQLIYRVYNNHLEALNEDGSIRQSYMSLLDEMVKEGSSDAYWIREYMISFRPKT